MEIVVDKEMSVSQLARSFNEIYPFLKIEIYHNGNEVSTDCFHNLLDREKYYTPQNAIFKYVMKRDTQVVSGYVTYLALANP
ncbi:MAG: hypothetical protein EOO43_17375 [Flavobacterium sp.]|nr:MAG: hypothetical protein EOO43_17375 [Flavobacterium sp.]